MAEHNGFDAHRVLRARILGAQRPRKNWLGGMFADLAIPPVAMIVPEKHSPRWARPRASSWQMHGLWRPLCPYRDEVFMPEKSDEIKTAPVRYSLELRTSRIVLGITPRDLIGDLARARIKAASRKLAKLADELGG